MGLFTDMIDEILAQVIAAPVTKPPAVSIFLINVTAEFIGHFFREIIPCKFPSHLGLSLFITKQFNRTIEYSY